MFLSKKDVPRQYIPMWYAGLLNLGVCYFNLGMYHVYSSTGWLTMLGICISLITTIVIFTTIKNKTSKMLWDKLTKKSNGTISGGEYGPGAWR